jgi:hypothetical protein
VRSDAVALILGLWLGPASPAAKEPPPATPRLVLKIVGTTAAGEVRATIENHAALPVAIDVVPAFALRPIGPDEASWPAFRAPADLATARPLPRNGSARLQLAGKQQQTAVVPLESLYWDHYQSVFWPFRPLRRVVLPGRYELSLEVRDPETSFMWRSNPIPAVVSKTGTLRLVKPD